MKLTVVLIRHFTKLILPQIDVILNSIWTIFHKSVDTYQKNYITSIGKNFDTETEDGDKIGLSTFLCEVISFLTELVMTKKGQKLIKPLISQVLAVLISLSQITMETLEEWDDDVESFRQDQEAIMACAYSMSTTSMVRACAQEALLEIMPCEYSSSTKYVEYLYQAVNLALEQHSTCWQIQEATALTVSGIYELCIETEKKVCEQQFMTFYQQICLPFFNDPLGSPNTIDINVYTAGRFLICGGKFIMWLSPDESIFLLKHISSYLKSGLMPGKILAIQALHDISEKLKDSPRKDELAPTINDNIQAILALAFEVAKENQENNNTNQDLLSDCLEVLDTLFEVDQNTTSVYSEEVTKFVCLLLRTNKSDPLMADSVICLLDKLLANHVTGSADNVVEQMTKVIFDLLTDREDDDSLTLKATALEALEHIAKEIRKCQDRREKKPELYSNDSITEGHFIECIKTCFLPMMHLVLNSDYSTDSQIIENATSVCKSIFSCKYGNEIMLNLRSDESNGNRAYIEYVLQLVAIVLDPKVSESGAASIGKMINAMILKCGAQLQENGNINQILTLVLKKLDHVHTMSIFQTLLLVFGQLMCENVEAVIKILSNQSLDATKFLLALFVEKFPDFFGFLERKIGSIALINLLKYLIENNCQELMSMEVNGEIIVENTKSRMVTRSKAKTEPVKFQQIPFLLKLYKVLLQECSSHIDRKTNNFNDLTQSNGSDDDEWVEDDDEDVNQEDSFSANQFLDGCLNLIDDDEQFYDEFEKQDNPFGEVDTLEYLGNILKEVKGSSEIFSQLNNEEMKAVNYFELAN